VTHLSDTIRHKAQDIKLLILDVDGVLTDGTLLYTEHGEETKRFHVKDGLGIRLLMESGIQIAVITARTSQALERRIKDMGITLFYPGQDDKVIAFEKLVTRLGLSDSHVAYVGDDILDLPVMRRAGLAITVQDGHALVKAEAHWVTQRAGGQGAVREIADEIISCKKNLLEFCDAFLATGLDKSNPE